jgi:2-polyprenyl-3-methyl-5-hydroxy-6-metoxy-1,4-benzoquinol methylase
MDPSATGRSYDQLAHSWQQNTPDTYGIAQLERAISFTKNRGPALDIGCGSHGRMIDLLLKHGFAPEGIDVSTEMIALARQRHPHITFHEIDISQWNFSRKYDLIIAWDSIWHLPLAQQEPVLQKICAVLNPGGIYFFTPIGFDTPTETTAQSCWGIDLPYSTPGIARLLELLAQHRCVCRHLEYDQYPGQHLVIIAQKI